MSESAIQRARPAPPVPPEVASSTPVPVPRSHGGLRYWARKVLVVAASLRITVVLFALGICLIFFGTLAQVDAGIWTVVSKYFRCFLAWIPLKIFFPRGMRTVPGGFPFPGGWLIAGLLLVNLLAAHAIRFRLTWKRAGVLVLHAGLIVMIAGEFITGLFAVESRMSIFAGKSANYVYNLEDVELAVTTPSQNGKDTVVSIPASLLRKQGSVEYEALPFKFDVEHYMKNSAEPRAPKDGEINPATVGLGLTRFTTAEPERNGVDAEGNVDRPSAYITIVAKDKDNKDGRRLGTYLFSEWFDELHMEPEKIRADGKTYELALRFKRTYTPYTMQLHEVTTEYYPDTKTPKSFMSRVRLIDADWGVDREDTISMNAPLRYRGETFYQASVIGENKVTVLQVVRNPGAPLPYVSCALVGLGMLVHFGIQLVQFLRGRAAA